MERAIARAKFSKFQTWSPSLTLSIIPNGKGGKGESLGTLHHFLKVEYTLT